MEWSTFLDQLDAILQFVVFGENMEDPVTLRDLVVATLILFVANLVSRGIRRALTPLADRARGLAGDTAVRISLRMLHWGVLLVGVMIALDTIGISLDSLSGLFTAGAVVTVAVGFAMQNIAQNFVSGAILAAERSIKAGDVLEVEGTVLRVQNVRIRTTVARTRDDEEVIIPNATLVQNAVKNLTYQDSLCRLRVRVGVAYGSDMHRVRATLEKVAGEMEWRSRSRDPVVLMTEFGSSSVDFEVSVWMDDPWRGPHARSELVEAIWWGLRDAGITIAFPQMDVHLDPQLVDALRERGSDAPDPSSHGRG